MAFWKGVAYTRTFRVKIHLHVAVFILDKVIPPPPFAILKIHRNIKIWPLKRQIKNASENVVCWSRLLQIIA